MDEPKPLFSLSSLYRDAIKKAICTCEHKKKLKLGESITVGSTRFCSLECTECGTFLGIFAQNSNGRKLNLKSSSPLRVFKDSNGKEIS
jgi:hypothetical protein